MRYTWMDEYLMEKPGVTKDLKTEWNWIRYMIGGKMFAAVCLNPENRPYYITLKLEPVEGDFFRQQYKDVIPGYYCNKMHWNSINPDGEVPDDLLREMLDQSYRLVLEGFSRKRQKEILEFRIPKETPELIRVPAMNCVAVRGTGDPNQEGGLYQETVGLLYGIAYTIKMSKKGSHAIEGYYDYVVPPLEGFWKQDGTEGFDHTRKEDFDWISLIRLPDFVKKTDFAWAVEEASKKKKQDFSRVEFLTVEEGLCVQILHTGSFDEEEESVARMDEMIRKMGYENDFSDARRHHEIYLSDARRTVPDQWRTIIRHPVRQCRSQSV